MPKPADEKPAAATPVRSASLYVVVESFHAEPVPYLEGEIVEADDPHIKAMPDRFRPFVFPHPVKRRTTLTTPEVRAE